MHSKCCKARRIIFQSTYWKAPKIVLAALALGIALPAVAQNTGKKTPILPEHLLNATYVFVEAYDGNEFDPRLLPEDRQAIADVERAIQKWGRYHLTMQRSEAEIVIQVRKGRVASVQGTVEGTIGTIPTGPNTPSGAQIPPSSKTDSSIGAGARAETGPPNDFFWVYALDTKGNLAAPYWRKTEKDGLNAPDLELFQKFKADVESAAAAQAKRKAAGAAPAANANSAPAPPATVPPATSPSPHH